MSPAQIALIQESFAKVTPIKAQAAAFFYRDLFAASPELEPYFAATDMDAQGDKLMATLSVVVGGLRDLAKLVPVAERLAVTHLDYGVQAEDYAKVGASLIRMLEAELGAEFTAPMREAWLIAYTTLSGLMINAAYPPHAAE